MEVPCPVPLQEPWSTAGYQVVELVNDELPSQRKPSPRSQSSGKPLHEPTRVPASPIGYRVTMVEEKTEVAPRRPQPQIAKRTSGKSHPLMYWLPIAAGCYCLLLGVIALVTYTAAPAPSNPGLVVRAEQPIRVQVPVEEPVHCAQEPVRRRIVLPAGLTAKQGVVLAVGNDDLAAMAVPGQEACPADDPGGRETFGTAVKFARNPVEAALGAVRERKLTFLLHVSGNFEDAGFT